MKKLWNEVQCVVWCVCVCLSGVCTCVCLSVCLVCAGVCVCLCVWCVHVCVSVCLVCARVCVCLCVWCVHCVCVAVNNLDGQGRNLEAKISLGMHTCIHGLLLASRLFHGSHDQLCYVRWLFTMLYNTPVGLTNSQPIPPV